MDLDAFVHPRHAPRGRLMAGLVSWHPLLAVPVDRCVIAPVIAATSALVNRRYALWSLKPSFACLPNA